MFFPQREIKASLDHYYSYTFNPVHTCDCPCSHGKDALVGAANRSKSIAGPSPFARRATTRPRYQVPEPVPVPTRSISVAHTGVSVVPPIGTTTELELERAPNSRKTVKICTDAPLVWDPNLDSPHRSSTICEHCSSTNMAYHDDMTATNERKAAWGDEQCPDGHTSHRQHPNRSCGQQCMYCIKFGFVNGLRRLYLSLGRLIGRIPWLFVLLTILVTASCAMGLHRVVLSTKIKEGYTPLNARSRHETETYQKFFSAGGKDPYKTTVLLRPRQAGGNLFDKKLFDQVMKVEHFLTYEMSVEHWGKNYTFSQFCAKNPQKESECAVNMVVGLLKRAMFNETSEGVHLAYPVSKFTNDNEVIDQNIATNFFNVTQSPDNGTYNQLQSCSLIVLYFQAFIAKGEQWAAAEDWEMAVYEWAYSGAGSNDPLLDILTTGDKMIITEMHRAGFSMARFFVAGFLLMIVFVFGSVLLVTTYHRAFRCSQFLVAIAALVAPMLSFFTTFGILAWTRMEFYPMMVLAPYLILAIGVDNAFLMMHAWHRLPAPAESVHMTKIQRSAERLGRILEDVGPSITVTSATNALAFGIGATTDTPVIRAFCLATGIAMVLCFVYELTFFGAILAWVGRSDNVRYEEVPVVEEEEKMNALETPDDTDGSPIKTMAPKKNCCQRCAGGFVSLYARFITSWPAIILVFILCIGIWTGALLGAIRIKTLVSIDKILPADTPLLKTYDQFDNIVWKDYYPVSIIVNKAPNLPNDTQLAMFNNLRHEFESGPGALGSQFTRCWLDKYEMFYEKIQNMDFFGMFYSDPDAPLDWTAAEAFLDKIMVFQPFVHLSPDKNKVTSFMFIAAYSGADNWDTRVDYMLRWRHIADSNPALDVTVWSPNGLNCDAILNLQGITRETVLITLAVMALICLLFIPSLCGVICATIAITSTTISVMGSLSWWGIDLDPMSVAAVLMAIGFSVDFTAHTSYHYQKAIFDNEPGCGTKAGRLTYTLESVGFPMFQAGFSTLLCVIPLAFHGDYAPEVLFKAITVLVFWGLVHGLVILPAFLAALPDCFCVKPDHELLEEQADQHPRVAEMQQLKQTCDDS